MYIIEVIFLCTLCDLYVFIFCLTIHVLYFEDDKPGRPFLYMKGHKHYVILFRIVNLQPKKINHGSWEQLLFTIRGKGYGRQAYGKTSEKETPA